MKYLIFNLLISISLICCHKNNEPTEVDKFMQKIKTESYEDLYLPAFIGDDISKLLEYSNDKTKIRNFPRNPISSFIVEEVTVGVIALWTIESIRVGKIIGDKNQYRNYGSLNLQFRHPSIDKKSRLQDDVADLYHKWWNKNSISASEKLKINPLQGTEIRWY